jgi:hypothetical protein
VRGLRTSGDRGRVPTGMAAMRGRGGVVRWCRGLLLGGRGVRRELLRSPRGPVDGDLGTAPRRTYVIRFIVPLNSREWTMTIWVGSARSLEFLLV